MAEDHPCLVWLRLWACAPRGRRLGLSERGHIAIDETPPVTPMTALVIDADGHLTYMGEDGCRRQIVGDPELLARLQELQGKDCTDGDGDWQL